MDILNNFETWTLATKIYFGIALFSTLVLVVQIFLTTLGFGHGHGLADGHSGVDLTAHHDLSGIGGITYFSISSITAFLTFFGWVGFLFTREGLWAVPTFALAFISGTVALLCVAFLLYFFYSMASSGNVEIKEAVGEIATVYLVIPKGTNSTGAVNVKVGDTIREVKAVSEDGHEIKTGTKVMVTGSLDSRTLIVRSAKSADEWMDKGL